MLIFGIVFFFVLGAIIASFLNVCIDRLPAGESIVSPPSCCSGCGRRLGPRELIPVFSYLWLKGRCRTCGIRIPQRILWVELGTGVLFGYLYWHYGLSFELLLMLAVCSVFIVLSVIDFDHQLLLNKIVYPSLILALLVSIFLSPSTVAAYAGPSPQYLPSFLPGVADASSIVNFSGLAQAAIGAFAGLLLFTLIIIVSRGGMGWGDAKLAGLVGALTGYLLPVAVFVAIVIGGLVAVFLLVFRIRKRKEGIPFGPFLAVGAVVALLWGNIIANWYVGRF